MVRGHAASVSEHPDRPEPGGTGAELLTRGPRPQDLVAHLSSPSEQVAELGSTAHVLTASLGETRAQRAGDFAGPGGRGTDNQLHRGVTLHFSGRFICSLLAFLHPLRKYVLSTALGQTISPTQRIQQETLQNPSTQNLHASEETDPTEFTTQKER